MILPGQGSSQKVSPEEVAKFTLKVLQRTVPAAVPGIVFLSGGQSELEATANLSAINAHKKQASCPWFLSFSYGRALQHSVIQEWRGKQENASSAQKILLQRAQANSQATQGLQTKVPADGNKASSQESTYVSSYKYWPSNKILAFIKMCTIDEIIKHLMAQIDCIPGLASHKQESCSQGKDDK